MEISFDIIRGILERRLHQADIERLLTGLRFGFVGELDVRRAGDPWPAARGERRDDGDQRREEPGQERAIHQRFCFCFRLFGDAAAASPRG